MTLRAPAGIRRRASIGVATAILLVAGSAPVHSEERSGPCRITGGYASLNATTPLPDGSFAFTATIIVHTRACGDGPKGVSGVFQPIAGSPLSCAPVETPRIDESACAFVGNLGVGMAGTPVVASATAHTSGVINDHVRDRDTLEGIGNATVQPGAEVESSECVLTIPEDGGRLGCSLF